MNDLETAVGRANIDVYCTCPHCMNRVDIYYEALPLLDDDLQAKDIKLEITCDSDDCQKKFIVTEIQ